MSTSEKHHLAISAGTGKRRKVMEAPLTSKAEAAPTSIDIDTSSVKQNLTISVGISKRRKVIVARLSRKRKAENQLGPANKRFRPLRAFDHVAFEAELRRKKDRCEAKRVLQTVLAKRTKEEAAARLELIHRTPNNKLLKRKAEHQLGPAKKRLRPLCVFDHVVLEVELHHKKDRCAAKRVLQTVLARRTKEEAAAPNTKLLPAIKDQVVQAPAAAQSKHVLNEITNAVVNSKRKAAPVQATKRPETPEGDKKPAARPTHRVLSPSKANGNVNYLPVLVDCSKIAPLTEAAVAGPESLALIKALKAARANASVAKPTAMINTGATKFDTAKKSSSAKKASPVKHSPIKPLKKFRYCRASKEARVKMLNNMKAVTATLRSQKAARREREAARAEFDEDFVVQNDHMDVEIDKPVLQQAGANSVMDALASPVVAADAVTDVSVPAVLATVAPVVQPRRRRRAPGPRIHGVSQELQCDFKPNGYWQRIRVRPSPDERRAAQLQRRRRN